MSRIAETRVMTIVTFVVYMLATVALLLIFTSRYSADDSSVRLALYLFMLIGLPTLGAVFWSVSEILVRIEMLREDLEQAPDVKSTEPLD